MTDGPIPASVTWRKSSRSNDDGICVEIAELSGGGRAVRDSKDSRGPVLMFTAAEWSASSAVSATASSADGASAQITGAGR